VGDFNGDGKPDFAFADQNGTSVSAYLNQGAGKFSAPIVRRTDCRSKNTEGAIRA
jgi:hypothetical protein